MSSFKCESPDKLEQLQCYINIDTNRLEGDLSEITERGEGATKSLISFGFDYEGLQSLNIKSPSHVYAVLNIGSNGNRLNVDTLLDCTLIS